MFVSYAHQDAPRVYPLLTLLTESGVNVWFDEGISPGNSWRDELAHAIDGCRLFLYFVTAASASSRNCQRECGYALDIDKPLLAVHLEETPLPHGLALSLAYQQAILAHRHEPGVFQAKLVSAVATLLGDHPTRPSITRRREQPPSGPHRWVRPIMLATVIFVSALAGLLVSRLFFSEGDGTRALELRRLTDVVGLEEEPALSPDAGTVAFVAVAGGRRQVWVRLISGGDPVAVTTGDVDHYGPRWTPDSAALVFYTPAARAGEQGAIWEMPALGGPARRVANALGPGDVSERTGEIAFFRSKGGGVELAVTGRDEASIRSLGSLPNGVYANPRWSPDGLWIAYAYSRGGTEFSDQLIVVPVAGGDATVMAEHLYLQGGFDWTPDTSGFIVSSARGTLMSYPPTYNLWRVPFGAGPSQQLTFGEFSYEQPDVGTDGTVVASRVRIESDVWRFPTSAGPGENAEAGHRVTHQTGLVQTLTINPSETEVAFLSDNDGHSNVWTARIEDGRMRPITRETDPGVVVAVPVWSPRGDWIAFLSSRGTTTSNVTLWLVRPDGSDLHDTGIVGAWACWSPDGNWLYYTAETASGFSIRKVPTDGGAPTTVRDDDAIGCGVHGETLYYARVLANDVGLWDLEIRAATPENAASRVIGRLPGIRVPSAAYDFQPIVSPNGRWLAMPLRDGATTNLWTLSTRTGNWKQLTDFGSRNVIIARRIAWSPDGRRIYASVSDIDSDIVLLVDANEP